MSVDSSGSINFDHLADSFVARLRAGERPALSEYVERYPEFAADILELFPALAEMEALKSDQGTGSVVANGANGKHAVDLPTHLGDYRILRLIGQGGMGVVYEARRESLSAHVALKVLHPHFRADGSYLRRFRNEARSAARLHHTNIVPVFDFGDHEGILYYVMQYIPGQGLDHVMADVRRLREADPAAPAAVASTSAQLARSVARGMLTGQFAVKESELNSKEQEFSTIEPVVQDDSWATIVSPSPAPVPTVVPGSISVLGRTSTGHGQARYHREVARIGAQVADALAHAHSLGVLHRDIKPPNLLLDARGNAWVTDFGLAKCEDGEVDITAPGDVPGTLRYMPPERFKGQSDRRGDIYALGVTLFEMIALRPVYDERDKPRLIRQILQNEPLPLRTLDPRVPRDLETIIQKAMAKDLTARYQTAAELAEDLRLFLEDRPPNARRSTPTERAWRWCQRNPMVSSLSAVAVLTLLAGTLISSYFAVRANTETGRANKNAETAIAKANEAQANAKNALIEKDRADVKTDEVRRILYNSQLYLAQVAWNDGQVSRVLDLLKQQEPQPGESDLRDFEW